ncbi:MAG: hypothetical protein ABFR62_05110 [Bacteroidota bacterium]
MKKLVYILTIFFSNILLAGYPQDDSVVNVTLNTQTEVDHLRLRESIGNLIIASEGVDQITDLSLLESISQIKGNVYIINNSELETLVGLDSILVNGDVYIVGNKNLTTIPGGVFNGELKDVVVRNNKLLRYVDGFENVESIRNLTIENNDVLNDLNAFSSLKEITGYIRIVGNKELEYFRPFANISHFEGELTVKNNVNLHEAVGLYTLYNMSSNPEISNNSVYTSDPENMKLVFMGTGDLRFYRQEEIDAFGKCYPKDSFVGDIIIDRSNITNLDGLKVLKEIDGKMIIKRNDKLESVNGLSNLESINHLIISFNKSLSDLKGLEKLSKVKRDVVIYRNTDLKDASSISEDIILGGKLVIKGNPRLVR